MIVCIYNDFVQMFVWVEKCKLWCGLMIDGNLVELLEIEKILLFGMVVEKFCECVLFVEELCELCDIFEDMVLVYVVVFVG